MGAPFQSNIQENKDWNRSHASWRQRVDRLSEQHPREQGLKPLIRQGVRVTGWDFQSNIQENKDWNRRKYRYHIHSNRPFRATSKRTRIETKTDRPSLQWYQFLFQSNIQENKDWNRQTIWLLRAPGPHFQSNIQENKDWNYMTIRHRPLSIYLSEQHPREQGLKPNSGRWFKWVLKTLSEQHPREQGLKPNSGRWFKWVLKTLSEQHPREQGLKHAPTGGNMLFFAPFQSNIQENKDWNLIESLGNVSTTATFRATSKRTRIETLQFHQ